MDEEIEGFTVSLPNVPTANVRVFGLTLRRMTDEELEAQAWSIVQAINGEFDSE